MHNLDLAKNGARPQNVISNRADKSVRQMFGLFKTKNKDKDVATNPDILFNPDVKTSEIKVFGLGLNDKADLIPKDNISTTTFEKHPSDIFYYPNGGTRRSFRDNKTYYQSTDGEKEYSLSDRIKAIIDSGGIFHMKSGVKYVVQDGVIIGIGLYGDALKAYKKIPKKKLELKFGWSSRIKEEYEQTDGELWNTYFYYEKRNMTITFSDQDKKISYISIGLFPYSEETRYS
jgi:hypothetical protein